MKATMIANVAARAEEEEAKSKAAEDVASDAPAATAATTESESAEFFVFNNGSGGDGVATFSFGGSHNDDFSEVNHASETIQLDKFKAKKVTAKLNSLFIATIPDGPPVLIACPAE